MPERVGAVALGRGRQQTDTVEGRVDPVPGGPRVGGPVGGLETGQVLATRQVGMEGRSLDQGTDPGQHLVGPGRHRLAEQLHRAGGRSDQPEQHPDGGGLARAVGTEESVDTAARNRPCPGSRPPPGAGTSWSGRSSGRLPPPSAAQGGVERLGSHRADGQTAVVGEQRGEQGALQQVPGSPGAADLRQRLQCPGQCTRARSVPPLPATGALVTRTEVQPVPTTRGLVDLATRRSSGRWRRAAAAALRCPSGRSPWCPGGGLKVNTEAEGVVGSKEVNATSKEGLSAFLANTCTRVGTWVLPSIAIRTEPTKEAASRGSSSSS